MADFSESPFQMDEDFAAPTEPDLSHSRSEQQYHDHENRINPNQPLGSPVVGGGIKQLRSRLARIKMEDGTGTTTEEDEMTYEEDLDDKYDGDGDGDGATANMESYSAKEFAKEGETLTPPENFAPVIDQIYRSSFPQTQNYGFLKKLKLKSVLCLIPEEYPQAQSEFFEKEGIRLFQLGMSGNKEPFVKISSELITKAIKIVIDPANQPILIHCNRGKHRTGCLVGVLRRLQGWSLTIIFDEYRKFAAPKERPMDQQFIELYDESAIVGYAEENGFLPMAWS